MLHDTTTFGTKCEHYFGKQIFKVFKCTVRLRRVESMT